MKTVSAAFKNLNTENCDYFWEDALISESDLIALIKAKKACGHFKVVVKEKPGLEESEDSDSVGSGTDEPIHRGVMSAAKFKEFISADVQTKIVLQADPTEPTVRRTIIDCAVKYLFQECGLHPSMSQRELLTKVICEIFRPFKSDEELVMKWILEKIKNVRSKLKHGAARSTACNRWDRKRLAEDSSHQSDLISEQMEFLETLLDLDDIPKIEKALKQTLKYRLGKYGNSNFSVFHTYKFFSKSLDLVSLILYLNS